MISSTFKTNMFANTFFPNAPFVHIIPIATSGERLVGGAVLRNDRFPKYVVGHVCRKQLNVDIVPIAWIVRGLVFAEMCDEVGYNCRPIVVFGPPCELTNIKTDGGSKTDMVDIVKVSDDEVCAEGI